MMSKKRVLCWDCKNKMKVPGSANIACAWRRGHTNHVWFFEAFDPNYPCPVFQCKGYKKGSKNDWTEEIPLPKKA